MNSVFKDNEYHDVIIKVYNTCKKSEQQDQSYNANSMNDQIVDDSAAQNYQIIKAHQVVLCGSSEVFSAMLEDAEPVGQVNDSSNTGQHSFFKSKSVKEIEIKDASIESLRIFIQLMYSNEIHIDSTNISEILFLARTYKYKKALAACMQFLTEGINTQNALQLYRQGQSTLHLPKLGQTYILQNSKVIFTQTINQDTPWEDIVHFLSMNALQIDEYELFRAIFQWGQDKYQDSTNDQKLAFLNELLSLIRLPLMTAENIMAVDKTLSQSVKAAAFLDESTLITLLSYAAGSSAVRTQLRMPTNMKTTPRHSCLEWKPCVSSTGGSSSSIGTVQPFHFGAVEWMPINSCAIIARSSSNRKTYWTIVLGGKTINLNFVGLCSKDSIGTTILHGLHVNGVYQNNTITTAAKLLDFTLTSATQALCCSYDSVTGELFMWNMEDVHSNITIVVAAAYRRSVMPYIEVNTTQTILLYPFIAKKREQVADKMCNKCNAIPANRFALSRCKHGFCLPCLQTAVESFIDSVTDKTTSLEIPCPFAGKTGSKDHDDDVCHDVITLTEVREIFKTGDKQTVLDQYIALSKEARFAETSSSGASPSPNEDEESEDFRTSTFSLFE
jgi:hypothetical protein